MSIVNDRKRACETLWEKDWIAVILIYLVLTEVFPQVMAMITPNTAGTLLTCLAIGDMASMVTVFNEPGATASLCCTIVLIFFTAVTGFGLHFWALGLVREQKVTTETLFEGFGNVGAILMASLMRVTCMAIWLMLISFASALPVSLLSIVVTSIGISEELVIYGFMGLVMWVGTILISWRYCLLPFCYYDAPTLWPNRLVRQSTQLMLGQYKRLFSLYLSFWRYYLVHVLCALFAWVLVHLDLLLSVQEITMEQFAQEVFTLSMGPAMASLLFVVQLVVSVFLLPKLMVALAAFYEECKMKCANSPQIEN
ncbi:MAG: DUF975 family protein [Eubacteriales bacterium]